MLIATTDNAHFFIGKPTYRHLDSHIRNRTTRTFGSRHRGQRIGKWSVIRQNVKMHGVPDDLTDDGTDHGYTPMHVTYLAGIWIIQK